MCFIPCWLSCSFFCIHFLFCISCHFCLFDKKKKLEQEKEIGNVYLMTYCSPTTSLWVYSPCPYLFLSVLVWWFDKIFFVRPNKYPQKQNRSSCFKIPKIYRRLLSNVKKKSRKEMNHRPRKWCLYTLKECIWFHSWQADFQFWGVIFLWGRCRARIAMTFS